MLIAILDVTPYMPAAVSYHLLLAELLLVLPLNACGLPS